MSKAEEATNDFCTRCFKYSKCSKVQSECTTADSYQEGYEDGYHQAETDFSDKAKVSSGWDGFYYGQGYKQAEKDLELTWEDMMAIDDLLDELLPPKRSSDELVLKGYYEEVLKRFNKERKEK